MSTNLNIKAFSTTEKPQHSIIVERYQEKVVLKMVILYLLKKTIKKKVTTLKKSKLIQFPNKTVQEL